MGTVKLHGPSSVAKLELTEVYTQHILEGQRMGERSLANTAGTRRKALDTKLQTELYHGFKLPGAPTNWPQCNVPPSVNTFGLCLLTWIALLFEKFHIKVSAPQSVSHVPSLRSGLSSKFWGGRLLRLTAESDFNSHKSLGTFQNFDLVAASAFVGQRSLHTQSSTFGRTHNPFLRPRQCFFFKSKTTLPGWELWFSRWPREAVTVAGLLFRQQAAGLTRCDH